MCSGLFSSANTIAPNKVEDNNEKERNEKKGKKIKWTSGEKNMWKWNKTEQLHVAVHCYRWRGRRRSMYGFCVDDNVPISTTSDSSSHNFAYETGIFCWCSFVFVTQFTWANVLVKRKINTISVLLSSSLLLGCGLVFVAATRLCVTMKTSFQMNAIAIRSPEQMISGSPRPHTTHTTHSSSLLTWQSAQRSACTRFVV